MSRFSQLALPLGAPVPITEPLPPVSCKPLRSGDPHRFHCVCCGKIDIGPLDGNVKYCQQCKALKPSSPLPAHWRLAAYKGFREWLLKLWQHGYVHGSELVDEMWLAYEGNSPGPAAADSLLNEAERLGWILRRENDPTLSQRVDAQLSSGQRVSSYHAPGQSGYQGTAEHHASHWYYSPNRDSADALAFLGSELEAAR